VIPHQLRERSIPLVLKRAQSAPLRVSVPYKHHWLAPRLSRWAWLHWSRPWSLGIQVSRMDALNIISILTFLQVNKVSLAPVSARSRTPCDLSHLERPAYLRILGQTQIILPVYTEIESTHGTTQVSSNRLPMTTSRYQATLIKGAILSCSKSQVERASLARRDRPQTSKLLRQEY
jgi:hypothetical protein